jgi:RNA polymerase sigma factor (sigma-70 family)
MADGESTHEPSSSGRGDIAWDQFEHTGDGRDLDEVIQIARHTVSIGSAGAGEEVAALSNLGVALLRTSERTGRAADLDEATDILRRAVAIGSPGAGEEVAALSNLGAALLRRSERTGRAADLDEATDILRRAIALSPSGSPERAAAMSSLGDALRLRLDEARGPAAADQTEQFRKFVSEAVFVYEEVVATRTRVLGADHPDTLASMNNLAAVLQDQGDLGAARQLHERVVAASRRVLGEDHIVTLASLNNLAAVLHDLRDLSTARGLHEQVVAIRRRLLGDNHPDTLASMNNLATVIQDQGELDEARVLYEQVVAIRRRLLGDNHPDTLTSMNNLVAVLQRQGALESARALQEHVLATIAMEQAVEGGVLAGIGEPSRAAGAAAGPQSSSSSHSTSSAELEDRDVVRPRPATTTLRQGTDADELVQRVRRGDAAAWEALVERHTPLLWSVVRSYGLGQADSADVVRSVWLLLVGNVERLRDEQFLSGWLVTAARRECQRLLRALDLAHESGEVATDLADHVDVDTDLLVEERRTALQAALHHLPERCQRLLQSLAAEPPQSYREIAASLGMPIGSIGPTRARCLARLRRLLEDTTVLDPERADSSRDSTM